MPKTVHSAQVRQAAYNNAVWCDDVCHAQGAPGEFQTQVWFNRNAVPRFYPNVVTLSGQSGLDEQMLAIESIIREDSLATFAVKDSFDCLELTEYGFQLLFEAVWLWRAPSARQQAATPEGVQWAVLEQPHELAQWERAWAALPANRLLTSEARVFLPTLLEDQDIAFIAAYRDEQIVGGAAANRTGNVVGLSNQFAPEGEAIDYWAGCINVITELFPDHAVVSYERGAELEIAQALGFDDVGPCRVWICPDAIR